MSTVLERVQKGAALLDEKFGPEWVESVNTEALNLGSLHYCVLGQLYGEYFTGRDDLWPDEGDLHTLSSEHGFDVATYGGSYRNLRRYWVKVIRERRAA